MDNDRKVLIDLIIKEAKKWQLNATHRDDCKTIEYPICSCGVGQLCELIRNLKSVDGEPLWQETQKEFRGLE